MAQIDTSALDALLGAVRRFTQFDPRPLFTVTEQIIDEDNRRGIMQRIDGFDRPLADARYRPTVPAGRKQKAGKHHPLRTNVWRDKQGRIIGVKHPGGPKGNNLSWAQYRLLDGPGTAPRGEGSRVITNLYTRQQWTPSTGDGLVGAAWADVVSSEGYAFLEDLFDGKGKGRHGSIAPRDLRGIRAWGRSEIDGAIDDWGEGHVLQVIYST